MFLESAFSKGSGFYRNVKKHVKGSYFPENRKGFAAFLRRFVESASVHKGSHFYGVGLPCVAMSSEGFAFL